MNEINANQLLAQLRINAALAKNQAAPATNETRPANNVDFGKLLKDSIDRVNEMQQVAGDATRAFEKGEPGMSIEQVMIASQKANVSFQTMLQVRNKLVNAYQEIMNMQV